jgi:hypothetical protein
MRAGRNGPRLATRIAQEGDWLFIANAVPSAYRPVSVKVGSVEKLAFIDGDRLAVKCPKLAAGEHDVLVDGVLAGSVTIS